MLFCINLPLESLETLQKAKDNGDIYIVAEDKFIKDIKQQMQTESLLNVDNNEDLGSTASPTTFELVNFNELLSICNSSFSIPMRKPSYSLAKQYL